MLTMFFSNFYCIFPWQIYKRISETIPIEFEKILYGTSINGVNPICICLWTFSYTLYIYWKSTKCEWQIDTFFDRFCLAKMNFHFVTHFHSHSPAISLQVLFCKCSNIQKCIEHQLYRTCANVRPWVISYFERRIVVARAFWSTKLWERKRISWLAIQYAPGEKKKKERMN